MAYAPNAIRTAATAITGSIGGAVFSGVVGDAAHSYGYHLARNQLPGSDYSVQLAADRDGNGDAASALDISLPPDQMVIVTARLRAAAKAGDPRLYALREFAGTLDGRTTFNRDLAGGGEGFGNWDDSHLWHVHLSGYRRYADDADAWRAIADVFTDTADFSGGLQPTTEEDDMTPDQAAALARIDHALSTNPQNYGDIGGAVARMDARVEGIFGGVAGLPALLAADNAALIRAFVAAIPAAGGPTVTDEQMERALRSVLGSLDD